MHSNTANNNQWYNQSGSILGAINQDYTPTKNDNYYVIVTVNGCASDISNIINVVLTGIELTGKDMPVKVYPNPVTNELIIEKIGNTETIKFEILNSSGQKVFRGNLVEKTFVQTSGFSSGVYIIKIENGKAFDFKKIIKK
ncbi:MAG: T9SS type A sorting domain-containing protein [Bacteroidales bacterium]